MFVAIAWCGLWFAGVASAQDPATRGSLDRFVGEADVGIRAYQAVLFAAQDYRDDSLDLKSPLADIAGVGRVLHDQYGFAVKAVNNATRADVLRELAALADLPPDTAVLVYFSGHGEYDREEERGYWLPVDARRDDAAREGWVSSDDVVARLRKVKAAHVLFVADSCFSGKFFDGKDADTPTPPPETAAAAREIGGSGSRWWISAGGDAPVPDAGGCEGMSKFSCAFASQLRESRRYYVVPDAFFVDLRQSVLVSTNGAQRPAQGPIAGLPGSWFGQLVLLNQRGCGENVQQKTAAWEAEAHEAWERVRAAPTAAAIGEWLAAWGEPRAVAACGAEVIWTARDAGDARLALQLAGGPVDPQPAAELGMTFVDIAPGTFLMGSPKREKGRDDDEGQHEVTLTRGFQLQTLEVTQGQFEAVMGYNPARTKHAGTAERDLGACDTYAGKISMVDSGYPAICVTWSDAVEFANRLSRAEGLRKAYHIDGDVVTWDRSADGYRLPTEAEWEYAARAGSAAPWGGAVEKAKDLCAAGNVGDEQAQSMFGSLDKRGEWAPCSDGVPALARGGLYAANAWGLSDMVGNVWEWTWDTYGPYDIGVARDPASEAGDSRVYRGGCWSDWPAFARVASRDGYAPGSRNLILGFRLARSIP